jgi:hypothetical protein
MNLKIITELTARQLFWQEQIIAASKGEALGMAKLQNEMPKNA